MPEKVKWYQTFNPFAHKAAAEKSTAEKKKTVRAKTKPIDWTKRIKEQEAAKAKKATVKKAPVKVVKPKKKKY